jgi:hypothetical protein
MLSRQIQDLNEDDLNFLEKLLGAEFVRQNEYAAQFKTKNGYAYPNDTQKILRLINAVRSQKRLTQMPKW